MSIERAERIPAAVAAAFEQMGKACSSKDYNLRCEGCRALLSDYDSGECMRTGWPKCCGLTMVLERKP